MPGHSLNKPVVTSSTSILRDINGTPLITIDSTEYSVIQPDGTISVQKNYTSIVLVDGTTWNPRDAYREKDPVTLAVCTFCRRGAAGWFRQEAPTHGLLSSANAERCATCGETCCPRHRERCADGEPRCRPCARRFRRRRFLTAIFFEEASA